MFRAISSRANFPALEETYLRLWDEEKVFEKSVEQRQGQPRYILYEGPPTANGSPGLHHVLARVFKDLFPRYKAMKGFYAPRKAGWDCHGLPVELEVEKELGLSSKGQIESFGVEKFNQKCRESVFRYLKDWEALTQRIAFWIDLEHPYITMTNEYIESCWWIIKRLWDKDLIYEGHRVTPHCPRCVTSLSSHEVALGYRDDARDPSIYVKFPLTPQAKLSLDKPAYLLAWTTTPWTLPGNAALAVAAEADYVAVEVEGELLILADALLEKAGPKGRPVVARFTGNDLVDLTYEPLYKPQDFGVEVRGYNKDWKAWMDKVDLVLAYPVISADFVSMEEGTGIVHIAPAFGEVDYEAGKEKGLYFLQPVDLQGIITGQYPFSGRFVKEADPLIIKDLSARGLLHRSSTITHTYPFCWRCNAPLLYYAKPSWYIRTTAVKDILIQRNQEINWYPEHIKDGRFGDWLENNVDWALSRERYWGTPLPIWWCRNPDCGHVECIGSVNELKQMTHHQAMAEAGHSLEDCLQDLHRPFVDNILLKCPSCQGVMRRLPGVIDCWFDSGAMPIAQWHYPLENRETFKQWYPADYICEAVDQTRGWFYTLHAIASLLEATDTGLKAPCFKNVICLGLILDAKGEKMSKARGNVVDPWQVIKNHGADALRWYMLTASPPGNVRRFDMEQLTQDVRQFLLPLWNTYSFFVTYANIDRFDPRTTPPPAQISDLDRWILSELNLLTHQVTQELDNYDPPRAGKKIEEFIDNLSNWYVRRSRRRFWKSENDADKQAAYFTLYRCLVTLAHLLAPFTPFLAEELYQNLVRSVNPQTSVSVHLRDFPQADLSQVDEALMEHTQLAIKVCSLGRAARSQGGLKVRQPLPRVLVRVQSAEERKGLEALAPQILEELNVKALEFVDGEVTGPTIVSIQEGEYTVAIDTNLTPELKAEGLAREIVHRLQTLRRQAGFDIADYIITYYEAASPLKQVMRDFALYIKQETLSQELVEGVPQDSFHEQQKLKEGEILLGVKKL